MPRFLRNKVYMRLFVSVLALMVFAGSELFAAELPNTKPSPETLERELDLTLLQLAGQHEWVSWDDIKEDPETIEKISAVQDSYRLALDPQFPREKWHLLFRAEIGYALARREEPVYLRSFSKQVGVYLRKFLEPHKEAFAGQDPAREAQMRKELALKVLLGMSAYQNAGCSAAWNATFWHQRTWRNNDHPSWYAAWYDARNASYDAADQANLSASSAAIAAGWSVIPCKVAYIASCDYWGSGAIRVIWREAEMAANIYLLRNFDAILSKVFKSLENDELGLSESAQALFASSESWADFKAKHFSFRKRRAVQLFFRPWLEVIDGLVLPLAGGERGL